MYRFIISVVRRYCYDLLNMFLRLAGRYAVWIPVILLPIYHLFIAKQTLVFSRQLGGQRESETDYEYEYEQVFPQCITDECA